MGDSLTASAATPPPKPSDPGLTRGSPEGGGPVWCVHGNPACPLSPPGHSRPHPLTTSVAPGVGLGWMQLRGRPPGAPNRGGQSRMDLDPAFRPFPLWVSHFTFTLQHRRPGSLERDPV